MPPSQVTLHALHPVHAVKEPQTEASQATPQFEPSKLHSWATRLSLSVLLQVQIYYLSSIVSENQII